MRKLPANSHSSVPTATAPVVDSTPSPALMQVVDAEIEGRCAVGPQIICHHSLGNDGVFLQKLAHQFQSGMLVALELDQHIRNLALGVDGASEVNHAPIDFQIDFVKIPSRMRLGTALAQFCCYDRSEMIHLAANGLVRNWNSALGEQILGVTKADREPEIEPNRLMNNLGREPISGVADFQDPLGYQAADAMTTPQQLMKSR